MRKTLLAALAIAASTLSSTVAAPPADARPLGAGWSGRSGAHWRGPLRVARPGYRHHRGRFVATGTDTLGGRYLSDDAWFLSDTSSYLAEPYDGLFDGSLAGGHGYPGPYRAPWR
jgi:hypothetical protein